MMLSVFTELTVRIRPFVHGPRNEAQIKDAKEIVLNTYYRRSGPVNTKDLNHSEKIKRVHQTLCEFIRHPDRLLSILFEKRAVTQQEHESIRSQTTLYQWASSLLDVLSVKPVSTYQNFLQALDITNQYHLHRLLEEKGYLFQIY